MNIRCSNRCAKPVRPGRSFAEPTRYHVDADERDAVVLVEDDAEAVRQRELGKGHLQRGLRGG